VISDIGKEYVVDLTDIKRYGSRGRYTEYNPPCSHDIVAARHPNVDAYSLFGLKYTILCYRIT
jgi:hypothetical protein